MVAEGSVMGVVAQEQFSHFTDEEVEAIHGFLSTEWTAERGLEEEKKIPILFRKQIDKGNCLHPDRAHIRLCVTPETLGRLPWARRGCSVSFAQ
jgi:hypothetical protein